MTNTATIRPLAPVVEHGVSLKRFEVIVDGERVGTVGQHRADTVRAYAGSSLGRTTTRTCWFWQSEDNAGDFEFTSRAKAVADLLDFI